MVGGVVEVYPLWDISEQDFIAWFNNIKVVTLGVIRYNVLLPNPTERQDFGDGALVKPYLPIAY